MQRKSILLNEINSFGFPEKEVALILEDFFNENTDLGSIGVNLDPQPTTDKFLKVFSDIKYSPKTENIYVRISDTDTDWFYSDTVYIVGKWELEELREKLKQLRPDEIYKGWLNGKPVNTPETKNKVYSVWWD